MERDWIDYVAALASPVLVALFTVMLTIIGWKYRQTWERNLKLEEQLRTDRVEIYKRVIEPFLIAFASDEAWKAENKKMGKNEALNSMITSMDYRKTSFFLTLIGSDGVVNAHKNLFQYVYKSEGNIDPSNVLLLLGNFLLEIRKSMGNESTAIDQLGMLEWFITDIDRVKKQTD